jgi:dTMP kinase
LVLVVIDGLDASGKSTQAIALCRTLRKNGKTVLLRFHPSDDNLFGTKVRQFLYLKGKNAHFASAFFYMIDVIRSVLLYCWQKYDCIIFVRYLMGTAYLPSPAHMIAYRFFTIVLPTSDYMFFLDVQPEEADRRIRQTRNRREMFENMSELKKIRTKAISLALMDEWHIIDAGKPVADVEEDIANVVQPLFQNLEL